mmetsp:Transcript_32151/g.60032  ORF Transcript_32151/g.60032 Transcript_32151/m.60032 type:complete len:240 (+) Transcript_32151:95-814(+)
MRTAALLLVALAHAGHGHEVQMAAQDPVTALAELLVASQSPAAFNPSGPGVRLPGDRPSRAASAQMRPKNKIKRKKPQRSRTSVVLKQDVYLEGKLIGKKDDVISVKYALAEQVLERRGWAYRASAGLLKQLQKKADAEAAEKAAAKGKAQELSAKLKKAYWPNGLTMKEKAGPEGVLFGAVTTLDIEKVLSKEFPEAKFDRKDMEAPDMKRVGEFEVEIKLHPDVTHKLLINVEAEKR